MEDALVSCPGDPICGSVPGVVQALVGGSQLHVLRCFRQGYEDPHWQYPGAAYRDNHAYQSHQWQPTAWQGNRGTSGSMDGPPVVMLSPGWDVL